MPREAKTIPHIAMRIAEISRVINIKTNPAVMRQAPGYQTDDTKASETEKIHKYRKKTHGSFGNIAIL